MSRAIVTILTKHSRIFISQHYSRCIYESYFFCMHINHKWSFCYSPKSYDEPVNFHSTCARQCARWPNYDKNYNLAFFWTKSYNSTCYLTLHGTIRYPPQHETPDKKKPQDEISSLTKYNQNDPGCKYIMHMSSNIFPLDIYLLHKGAFSLSTG